MTRKRKIVAGVIGAVVVAALVSVVPRVILRWGALHQIRTNPAAVQPMAVLPTGHEAVGVHTMGSAGSNVLDTAAAIARSFKFKVGGVDSEAEIRRLIAEAGVAPKPAATQE
jgi:hypothetical protein